MTLYRGFLNIDILAFKSLETTYFFSLNIKLKTMNTFLKLNFDKNYRYYVLNQYALPRNNKNFMILNFFNE